MLPRDRFELSERQQDVASVWQASEEDALPDGVAQLVLVALAYTGYGVRCYQSGGSLGTWCVWIDRLAEVRPDKNGRVTVEEWIAHYADLLVEMGYPDPAQESGEEVQ